MSRVARSRTLGTLVVLSLALAGLLLVPAGASAEGMANLKVRVIEKDFLENIENADVHCVNVHTGEMYDLYWDTARSRYQTDVPDGSYAVFATAEGYSLQESPSLVSMITSVNDDTVEIIRLKYIPQDITLEFEIKDGIEYLEGAAVHVFADEGQHLSAVTNISGIAKVKAPMDVDLHILVFYEGMKTESINGNWNTSQDWNLDLERPSEREDSYKVIGFVKDGARFVADVDVHVWDSANRHMVPLEEDFEGALSLPLYNATFEVLIEAKGYEAQLVEGGIDLTSQTYFVPDNENESFEMSKISETGSRVTTVSLDNDVMNPVIETVWTMDANSVFWGAENDFGNPRMQISGPFYSPDWMDVDGVEANDTVALLESLGPTWITTGDFFSVNSEYYTADLDGYSVDITDLAGEVQETGVNPVVTMTQPYTSDMEYDDEDVITIEVFDVMEGEIVEIKLPDNYEILGDFGDSAEFMNTGRSQMRVFEALEFTAKVKEAPEAVLDFTNYYDFYEVDDKEYIVNLDTNVTLTGRNSDDMVGEIENYLWNLPASVMVWDEDEETLAALADMDLTEMEAITIQFPVDVHFNVTLGVKDSAGDSSKTDDWVWITADGTAPTIDDYTLKIKDTDENVTLDGENYTIDEDVEFFLNATTATDGEHGEIVDYVWLFDDASGALNGDVVTKMFADPGFYNIQLKIKDAVGNEFVVDNKTVVVTDITKPMSVIKPFSDVTQGDDVEMNATQSYDPRTSGNLEEDIVAWTWYVRKDNQDWDEQVEIGNEQVFTYVFEDPGTYIVNLSVEDKMEMEGYSEKILMVSGPDLQVLSLTFESPNENELNDGESPKISITYSNEGTMAINDTWVLRVTVNGDKIKEETIDANIAPGEINYFNFTYELPKGDDERTFEVELDYEGTIAEMNEENNHFETIVTVEVGGANFPVWVILVVILVVLVGYVVYMKFTRQEWGYEPIQRWWENRNK
ncbi:MAG: PKD domain-containing protein [Candidatus Thermoplasmatota archaeon]|nr:PKD domain-containing protein [Candidatus Thermoplasmatota archaeon]